MARDYRKRGANWTGGGHAGTWRDGPPLTASGGRIDATRVAAGAGEVHEQVRGSRHGEQLRRGGLDIVARDHGRAGDHVLVRVPPKRQRPPAQDLGHISLWGVVAGTSVTVDVERPGRGVGAFAAP